MKRATSHQSDIFAMGEACVLAFFGRRDLIHVWGEQS